VKQLLVAFCALVLGGCTVITLDLPVAGPNDTVHPIKDRGIERMRAGNVLFVNRSIVWRKVLVFDGHFSKDELIGFGADGLPALMTNPIGRFDIDPAQKDAIDQDSGMNRKLVRFPRAGQRYTLLIVSEDAFGGVLATQFVNGRVADRPMSEQYWYRKFLGPMAGQTVYETINDVEYLPDVWAQQAVGTNYLLDMKIDINDLLRRGIHGTRDRHPPHQKEERGRR
jgi:hypothetical protein